MIYTILGGKDHVKKEVSNLIKGKSRESVSRYDMGNKDININNIIMDLDTVSLFGEKTVIIDDIEKLEDYDDLIKYIFNPNNNTLILTSTKQLDKRKKITKVLSDNTKIIDLFDFDFVSYLKNNLEDYRMSFKDINLLIDYCGSDIGRLDNELSKLKLYKIEDKEITSSDIKKLVKRSYDSTIFNLIDSVNRRDIESIRRIYGELISMGDSDDKIMYTIANHYRLLYQISVKTKYLDDKEIISEYNMHPYRLTKLKEQLNMISDDEILNILKSLGDIDINYKMGKKNLSDEMFLFFERLN